MSRREIRAIPSPKALNHPILNALESATKRVRQIMSERPKYLPFLIDVTTKLNPERTARWLEDPEHYDRGQLRHYYQEQLFAYVALQFNYRTARAREEKARKELLLTIAEAISYVASHQKMNHRLITAIIENNCLEADSLVSDPTDWHLIEEKTSLPKTVHHLIEASCFDRLLKPKFENVVRTVRQAKDKIFISDSDPAGNLIVLPRHYPTEVAVPGGEKEELRTVPQVWLDDDSDRLPAFKELASLLAELSQAAKVAESAIKRYKSQTKGSLNEAQHAGRLVCGLFENTSPEQNQRAIADQNERRQVHRAVLVETEFYIATAEHVRGKAVIVFARAIDEVESLTQTLDSTSGESAQSAKDQQATRTLLQQAQLSCLAIDAELRAAGRALEGLTEHEDNTNARSAYKPQPVISFEELHRRYERYGYLNDVSASAPGDAAPATTAAVEPQSPGNST